MTLANSELYKALIEAGASNETALKAAESVAGYDRHFERLDGRLNTLMWMVGMNITITLLLCGGLIWKVVDMSEKIGALTQAVSRISS